MENMQRKQDKKKKQAMEEITKFGPPAPCSPPLADQNDDHESEEEDEDTKLFRHDQRSIVHKGQNIYCTRDELKDLVPPRLLNSPKRTESWIKYHMNKTAAKYNAWDRRYHRNVKPASSKS